MTTYSAIITKVTRQCNLRCNYCHDWRSKGEPMSFEVLARLTSSAMSTFDNVQFIWHGGETTTVGIDFYERAMFLQARYLRSGCAVRNDIQTNGTLIDKNWASFFADNGFGVGISIDGPPELHDRHRRFANGKGSFTSVMNGINQLRSFGIKPSVLMVIDKDTLELGAQKIFDFFLTHDIKSYGCLPSKPLNIPNAQAGTKIDGHVGIEASTKFFCDLFDIWHKHGDSQIRIRELQILVDKIKGVARHACTVSGGCLGKYFMAEPEGDISHCDLFLGDNEYTYGNIKDMGFTEILKSEKLSKLIASNEKSINPMREKCPHFGICSGGCPHERYISYRHDLAHSNICCGKSALIEHIKDKLKLNNKHHTQNHNMPVLA